MAKKKPGSGRALPGRRGQPPKPANTRQQQVSDEEVAGLVPLVDKLRKARDLTNEAILIVEGFCLAHEEGADTVYDRLTDAEVGLSAMLGGYLVRLDSEVRLTPVQQFSGE